MLLLLLGCTSEERTFESVKTVLSQMQKAKLSNNCWAYIWYFEHGFTEIVHNDGIIETGKLRTEWAKKGVYEWQTAVCGAVRGCDIAKYNFEQPVVFSFPAYEKIENFKLERKSNRVVVCHYVLRGFGLDEWIEHDVRMTFKRGLDAEWKAISLERGPVRKSKIPEFN